MAVNEIEHALELLLGVGLKTEDDTQEAHGHPGGAGRGRFRASRRISVAALRVEPVAVMVLEHDGPAWVSR